MTTREAANPETELCPGALHDVGEHFAAGYMECPGEPAVVRFARGIASHLSHVEMPDYQGEALFPCSPSLYSRGAAVEWHYSACMTYNEAILKGKLASCDVPEARQALKAVHEALKDYPRVSGYTHSIPNYRRILHEGLDSYQARIDATRAIAERRGEEDRIDFCRAMSIVLQAVRTFHGRTLEHLRSTQLPASQERDQQDRLIAALERVPFAPATSFYQAIVAANFILYIDGPDDLGRFDQDLGPFYESDLASGLVSFDEAVGLVNRVWQNIDINSAWNVAIGGLLQDGASAINQFTHVCVKATEGMRRPNLALRIHTGAPDSIWDAAVDCIATGNGLPALYNEDAYIQAIREAHLGVSEEDLPDFAFGGCTELMVHGKSNVGSLEGDINLPRILVDTIHHHLAESESFEGFQRHYEADVANHIRSATAGWDENQRRKAAWQPQVIRSLLIDDCIENGREYNAGGCRYNWCVVNVMGLANVVDSLSAIRETVFGSGDIDAHDLIVALDADFEGADGIRRRLESCPRFGNGEDSVDAIAEHVSEYVFSELRRYAPWRGGRYIPACLMFVTYAMFGKEVAATPDGRKSGAPIADSAGAMQGRDRSGPTALMRSVARIRHGLAPGTLVVNARFSKRYFEEPGTRKKLKDLVRTYFELGGMQLQINVVDQQVLQDAYEHPENYGDLIIRVGGYSEYWTRLDDDLRRSILERVEHP